MKEVFYKRTAVGKRYKYVPVYEYDQTLMDAMPKGSHLISVYPGGRSIRYNVDPNYAAMIAAGRVAEDAMAKALMQAGEIRLQRGAKPITLEQKAAWDRLVEVFGPEAKQLEWPSAREVAEEGVKAMMEEAEKLMEHESVRKARDHFILMCKLVKEKEAA